MILRFRILQKELDSNLAKSYYWRGIAYASLGKTLGNYQNAIADYEESLKHNASDACVLYNLGNTHEVIGNFDKALEHYDAALKIDPHFKKALMHRAQLLEKRSHR